MTRSRQVICLFLFSVSCALCARAQMSEGAWQSDAYAGQTFQFKLDGNSVHVASNLGEFGVTTNDGAMVLLIFDAMDFDLSIHSDRRGRSLPPRFGIAQ
jgi:hypothetical protein